MSQQRAAGPMPAPSGSPLWVPSAPQEQPASRRHGHLWTLPDGTGLHAPPGQLTRDPETGQVCCHLCGRWFRALGSHVRAHGYTAYSYREAMGLCRTRALTAPDLSAAISMRQAAAYADKADVRARLSQGHDLARSGRLTRHARSVDAADRPERVAARRRHLAAGRDTAAKRREECLARRLGDLGATDLGGYLRDAYGQGASLATLAAATGLGRARLRTSLDEAGIVARPTGRNTLAGKQSRARAAEAAAAVRVGTSDVVAWMVERRAAGWTLTRLAAAVGHSTHWVRWRLPEDRRPLVDRTATA